MTKLDEMMAVIHNSHVYIQTHNFPDPDAIASAYGLQQLLSFRGVASTICYEGKIERYNTSHIIHELDIKMVNVEEIGDALTEKDEVLLVDAQKFNANIIDIAGEEIICIDHHPTVKKVPYRFSDIRPQTGSCATMIAEYFFENEIPLDRKTATVLTFGIRSDTSKLSRGVDVLDLEMIYRLFPYTDQALINHLENAEICLTDLSSYSKAIESIRVYDRVSFAYAGKDCEQALVSCISDFMLALVEINFSIVYSQRTDGFKFSVRSENGVDAGKITAAALKGVGSGGGHENMAGGFAPFQGTEEEGKIFMKGILKRFMDEIEKFPA
jgi:nanoRNase/pAp phosphatase (c-di-AMP/oligoRNAs hydrolase)